MSGVTSAVVGGSAGLITTTATLMIRSMFDRRAARHGHDLDYEYAQRRKLREVIGVHHGRALDAADQWNSRMRNLYDHADRRWLSVSGDYSGRQHYFTSTLTRFLALIGSIRLFEREAIYVDARYAERTDMEFVNFMRALRMFLTDTRVTGELDLRQFDAYDHFFADQLRQVADAIIDDGLVMPAERLVDALGIEPVAVACRFFDGLSRDEARVRWDRLVAHHLVVMAFVNSFGYAVQRRDDYAAVLRQFVHPEMPGFTLRLLENAQLLENAEVKKLVAAIGDERAEL